MTVQLWCWQVPQLDGSGSPDSPEVNNTEVTQASQASRAWYYPALCTTLSYGLPETPVSLLVKNSSETPRDHPRLDTAFGYPARQLSRLLDA